MKNSIEAMPQGGKLNIRVENESASYVTIVFEDTGVGISKERLASLGEPFFTTKEKGTGLGLMVTYKIIEDHGGEIQIDSELNQGTRTKIRLPKSFSKSVHEMLVGRDDS